MLSIIIIISIEIIILANFLQADCSAGTQDPASIGASHRALDVPCRREANQRVIRGPRGSRRARLAPWPP